MRLHHFLSLSHVSMTEVESMTRAFRAVLSFHAHTHTHSHAPTCVCVADVYRRGARLASLRRESRQVLWASRRFTSVSVARSSRDESEASGGYQKWSTKKKIYNDINRENINEKFYGKYWKTVINYRSRNLHVVEIYGYFWKASSKTFRQYDGYGK